jgi:hypothetical protein
MNKSEFNNKSNVFEMNDIKGCDIKNLCNPVDSLFPTPYFSDFLRFYHNSLAASPNSPLFLNSSNGVMHMPICLPKNKAHLVRSLIVEKLLDLYPDLSIGGVDSFCEPLFPTKEIPSSSGKC